MPSAKERLVHLLELAEQGPALRTALAEEITDLLLNWPPDCPSAMRLPCEALLEKAAREVDSATRARLARRIEEHCDLPITLLNAVYFSASEPLKKRIVARNESDSARPANTCEADERALVLAARKKESFAAEFARQLKLALATAEDILADGSGQSLAVACKGAHVTRAGYSALALLTSKDNGSDRRLEAYETVPQHAAERMLQAWRMQGESIRVAAQ